jgi:ribonuclease BN (tRNA processing enzyme)
VKVTLVPSAASGSPDESFQFLTSYLINDTIAIDAGCVGLYRGPHEQARIRHVLISHSHIDHLASLPILLENVFDGSPNCLIVHGNDAVLDCLRKDIFNDRVWPDFLRISATGPPFLKLSRLEPGKTIELEGLRITPVMVNHVVPSCGFVVEDDSAAVVFPVDTGPTEEIWERANRSANLKAVFLEACFPNSMLGLANVSRHLTPSLFAGEVRKLKRPATIFAVHIKPGLRSQVVGELHALGLPNLEIAQPGRVYDFGRR